MAAPAVSEEVGKREGEKEMNMTHDEMIAVIQAHAAGRPIEGRIMAFGVTSLGQWHDAMVGGAARFNFAECEYRIKPEPPKPREWALHITENGGVESGVPIDEVRPGLFTSRHFPVIVREVLPEEEGK